MSSTRLAWTVNEVAASLGTNRKQVLALIHADELGHIRAGRNYLVPDEELRRFLARGVKAA